MGLRKSSRESRAKRIDKGSAQGRPGTASREDNALVDLQLDPDVDGGRKGPAQVRGQSVAFPAYG